MRSFRWRNIFDFGKLKRLEQLLYDIASDRITIKQAKDKQNKMNQLKSNLKKDKPTN